MQIFSEDMDASTPKIIVIVGPTASGKSDLGLHIATKYDGEILCADSRTVYRGLDIGSAKPSAADQALVPHHLLDLATPASTLSVADFQAAAQRAIANVSRNGHIPVIVGGSGLYVDSVLYGLSLAPAADLRLRQELEQLTLPQLAERLAACDPDALERVDRHNPRRLIRAIETAGLSRPVRAPLRRNTLVMGIDMNKEIIQKRIRQRIEIMLAEGFLGEVEALGRSYGFDNEAMSGIGYRAFRGVIEGTKTVAEATDEFVRGDLRLVKKQLTWFRRNPDIAWLDGAASDLAVRADEQVAAFLARPLE